MCVVAVDSGYTDTPSEPLVVVSLSTADMELSTSVCTAVNKLARSIDKKTNRKLGQLNLSTGLLELSATIVFWMNLNSVLILFLIRFQIDEFFFFVYYLSIY